MTVEAIDLCSRPIRFDNDWYVAVFHADTDADVHADHWELHEAADEVVACMSGGMRLYLRGDLCGDGEEEVTLAAGSAVVVPKGRWHRIEVDGPSDIMAVTRRHGTRREKRG